MKWQNYSSICFAHDSMCSQTGIWLQFNKKVYWKCTDTTILYSQAQTSIICNITNHHKNLSSTVIKKKKIYLEWDKFLIQKATPTFSMERGNFLCLIRLFITSPPYANGLFSYMGFVIRFSLRTPTIRSEMCSWIAFPFLIYTEITRWYIFKTCPSSYEKFNSRKKKLFFFFCSFFFSCNILTSEKSNI